MPGCGRASADAPTEERDDALLRLQAALRESEARQSALLAALPDLVFRLDRSGTYLDYQADRFDDLAAPPERFLGRTIAEVLPAELAAPMMAAIERVLAHGRVETVEYALALPHGRRDFEARFVAVGTDEVVALVRDVTIRRLAEESLVADRDLLRAIMDTSPDQIYVKDADTRFVRVNPATARVLGVDDPAAAVGKTDADFFPSDLARRFEEDDRQVLTSGRPLINRLEPQGAGPDARWVLASKAPLRDAAGKVVGLVGINRDITEQRRLEAELRASEARFRSLVANASDLISILDADGIIRYQSPAVARLLGYDDDVMLGHGAFEFVHPDDRPRTVAAFAALVADPAVRPTIAFRCRHADGSWRWLEAIGTNLLADPAVAGIVVNSRDVTERRAAETALAAERDLLEAVLRHLPDAVYVKDAESRFLRLNASAAGTLGLDDPAAALGKTDADFHPADRAGEYLADERRVMATGEPLLDKLERRGDGEHARWLLTSKVPLRDAEGRIVGLIGSGRDVTAQRQLEEELTAARDAAEAASRAKGTFLATAAHELRTPLTTVRGFADLLLHEPSDNLTPEQRESLDLIAASAAHLGALVDALLDLSRIEAGALELEPGPIDLGRILGRIVDELTTQARAKGVDMLSDIPPDLPPLEADPLRLHQILLNLVANAVKFTERGRVAITARPVGDGVEIAIADTGVGIPAEALPHVFDEFRQADAGTTRRFGGSGLGLTIAKRLVELHGGTIRAESEPGIGSTFTIALPLRDPERRRSGAVGVLPPDRPG